MIQNISKRSLFDRVRRFHHIKSFSAIYVINPSIRAKRFHSTMTSSKPTIPVWATLDPDALGVDTKPYHVLNIVQGQWGGDTKKVMEIPNPIDKNSPPLCTIPETSVDEIDPFIESMKAVTKSGVHNPLKNVQRYLMYGEISRRVSSNFVHSIYFLYLI